MSTKKVNKYHANAIRKELDSCVRSHAWKRFRTVLKGCCPPSCFDEACNDYHKGVDGGSDEQKRKTSTDETDTSLLEAIVMDRPRSTRGTPSSHPTLLHALIDKINSGSCTSKSGYGRRSANQLPPPYDIIDAIAKNVPKALLVQDGKNGRTPLHLAISRNACPSVIESLIQNDHSKESLLMHDRRQDNPITCYIKTADMDFDEGGIGNLLLRNGKGEEALMRRAGAKGKHPAFYVAAKELREGGLLRLQTVGGEVRIPDTLRYILVRTYNYLIADCEKMTQQFQELPPEWLPSSLTIENIADIPLLHVFASAVRSSSLLGELSDPIFTILQREMEQELELLRTEGKSKLVDENGNTPLHLLALHHNTTECRATKLPQTMSGKLHNILLASCPEYIRLPNHEGNLPLHLAFHQKTSEMIKDFCDAHPGGTMHRNVKGELPLHVFLKQVGFNPIKDWDKSLILEQLLNAGPDAIAMTDGPTGLYPFQLPVEASFSAWAYENYDIYLAFELLKKKPDLCSIALEDK